ASVGQRSRIFSPPTRSLGARTSATFGVFRCLRSEPASPFLGRSRKKKQNPFPHRLLFWQILGGGKICPPILNWYQKSKFVANYFGFGIILDVKERYSNYTINVWKECQG
ncbi:MAG: hypothetical protein KKH11_01875, partial [Candidatus Omnitrophica bacterium]|nr:hypothetical protein [Candidatus Omnitrophota bacterium]